MKQAKQEHHQQQNLTQQVHLYVTSSTPQMIALYHIANICMFAKRAAVNTPESNVKHQELVKHQEQTTRLLIELIVSFSLLHISEDFSYTIASINASSLTSSESLRLKDWKLKLQSHPDKHYRETILQIIQFGAKIDYMKSKQLILSEYLSFAQNDSITLINDLNAQIQNDRVTKLTKSPDEFISSPLSLVSKSSGGMRRIHHLSHSKGRSINCNISKEWVLRSY